MNITQENQDTAMQRVRNLSINVYLLNSNMQIISQLSGKVIAGNISIDANSDIRRTCNIDMVMEGAEFDIELWLNKCVRIETGIENIMTGEIDWINQGVYLINNPVISYSGGESKLSFQGLDLMARLTGLRNGYLTDLQTQIPQGSSIRDSMISTLALAGVTNYIIEEAPYDTQYLINVDIGGTVYDILKELRNMIPNYEIFFDINGTFIYQKIPNGVNDPIMIDNSTWEDVVLSVEKTKSLDEIKNKIYVYGKSLEPTYFQTAPSWYDSTNKVLHVYYSQVEVESDITSGMIIGFVTPTLGDGIDMEYPNISINNWASRQIWDGIYALRYMPKNEYICLRSNSNGASYDYLGKQQILAIEEEANPKSPFYIGGEMGRVKLALIGGEYDNIYTDSLAYQRAKYELYLRCRMNDSINMNIVPLYYLDVNVKIEHQIADGFESNQYIIKSVSTDLSATGTQTIQAIRFYPEYPDW